MSEQSPEALITDLIAPTSQEQAEKRRRDRDHAQANALLSIIRGHHEGLVEGLTEDDLRTLASVAHRLHKGWFA